MKKGSFAALIVVVGSTASLFGAWLARAGSSSPGANERLAQSTQSPGGMQPSQGPYHDYGRAVYQASLAYGDRVTRKAIELDRAGIKGAERRRLLLKEMQAAKAQENQVDGGAKHLLPPKPANGNAGRG